MEISEGLAGEEGDGKNTDKRGCFFLKNNNYNI